MSFRRTPTVSSLGAQRVIAGPVRRTGSREGTPPDRALTAFVLRNRIHLLPAATLITWAGPPLYGSTPSWNALPSILLAGLGIYELNRVFDGIEDEINDPDEYATTSTSRTLVRTVAIGALAGSVVLSVILTNLAATVALAIMLVAGILYSVPFLRSDGKAVRLKQIPGLKNAVPSVVWPIVTIAYPAMSGTGVRVPLLVLAVTALAWGVFTIEVAWDVRDSRGDRVAGIRTLANTFGARRALLVPLVASCGEALVIVALVYTGRVAMLWLLPALLLVLLPTIAYLWRESFATHRDRSHLLILMNTLALILLGLAGRWEG